MNSHTGVDGVPIEVAASEDPRIWGRLILAQYVSDHANAAIRLVGLQQVDQPVSSRNLVIVYEHKEVGLACGGQRTIPGGRNAWLRFVDVHDPVIAEVANDDFGRATWIVIDDQYVRVSSGSH